jgi:hypothetical protein
MRRYGTIVNTIQRLPVWKSASGLAELFSLGAWALGLSPLPTL